LKESSEADIAKKYDERYKQGYREILSGYELSRCAAIKDLLVNIIGIEDKGLKILDYGCGSGAHVKLWENVFNQPILFFSDISQVSLDKLKEKYPQYSENVSIIIDNKTKFMENQFDLIVSIEVMEHVLNLEGYLIEIYRLLKPGGVFVWTTPCGNVNSIEHIYSKITKKIETTPEGYFRWKWEDPTHVRRLTSKQITNILVKNGFYEPNIFFRAHFFSFICSHTLRGPLNKFSHHLTNLDWILFKNYKNGASMVGFAKKSVKR